MENASVFGILAPFFASIGLIILISVRRCEKREISRAIPDMLNAAMALPDENEEERNKLLQRVVALWELGLGDAVGSCQSLPQKLVPVFVVLFAVNTTPSTGWRKIIYDRHFGGSRRPD